jgi:hypothetical protein
VFQEGFWKSQKNTESKRERNCPEREREQERERKRDRETMRERERRRKNIEKTVTECQKER